MRKLLSAAVVAGVSVAATQAGLITYDFPIDVAQEVPAPTIPSGFSPSGTGLVTLDTDTNELTFEITYQGLTGDIVSPGAHIHGPAAAGSTAGVFVFLAGGTSGNPLPQPPSGVLTGSAILTDTQEQWVLDGLAYVNIHTAQNGAGEIRGQVVPEPATIGLLGLAGLAVLRRR